MLVFERAKRVEKLNLSILTFALVLFISSTIYASGISVTMTVDRNTATLEDRIVVKVEVEGKTFVGRPDIHGIEDFEVRYAGASSQMQIINGRMSSSKVFQYLLSPSRVGRFTIGPAVIEAGGTQYRSGTVSLNVVGQNETVPQERYAYLSAQVSNRRPYVGEEIVYTLKFLTRLAVQNAQMSVPDFKRFWKEQIGDIKNYQQVINGQLWQVSEFKIALFPTEAGELKIDRASLTADVITESRRMPSIFESQFFSMFHDTERKVFKSSPTTLNVKPLPIEGRPAGFSGLVGSFSVRSEISSTEVEVGESTTLTITISGEGDLRNYPSPELKGLSDFKIYDDQPAIKVTPSDRGVKETKIFKKAIVPLKQGRLTIPGFGLSYFDPKNEKYIDMSTSPIVLNVKPSSHPERVIVSSGEGREVIKQKLKVLGEDLMPVIKDIKALKPDMADKGLWIWAFILAFIPFAVFVFTIVVWRRAEKARTDSGFIRRGQALKRAHKEMRSLAGVQDAEFYMHASRILKNYIGDRFNIDGRALTAADVKRRLEPLGVGTRLCDEIVNFINQCDAGLYGGEALGSEKIKTLSEKLKLLIKNLERRKRR